jgi:hypothetical protein
MFDCIAFALQYMLLVRNQSSVFHVRVWAHEYQVSLEQNLTFIMVNVDVKCWQKPKKVKVILPFFSVCCVISETHFDF